MYESKWNSSLIAFFLSVCGIGSADIGLIGGRAVNPGAYAAFVEVPSGNLLPIPGLPADGIILKVSLNSLGNGIIGGKDNTASNAYAAFVSSNGTLTPLIFSAPDMQVVATSINESGYALFAANTYAASVLPDGTVTELMLSFGSGGSLKTITVNDEGMGLIGGEGSGYAAYGAYISPTGMEILLDLPTDIGSNIFTAAINKQGNGLIGGRINGAAYAAFTTAGQTTVNPVSPLPPHFSELHSVAINDSGMGLIGGRDEAENAFAAYAATDGTVTPLLTTAPFTGFIRGVSINDSGQGIIGGSNYSDAYAAFVSPSGTVTPLIASPPEGEISSVAIDNSGIALFAGNASGQGYGALVAPNGALTFLDLSSQLGMQSVALSSTLDALVAEITPTSIGFFNSVFFTQLAISSTLECRFLQENKIWNSGFSSQTPVAHKGSVQTDKLLASNATIFPVHYKKSESALPCRQQFESTKNSIWVAPFGDFFHQKARGSIPNIRNNVGGFLLGYDRQGDRYLVGTAFGYAFNHLKYGNKQGHGNIQEEMASIYGAYYANHFWFDAVVWGGVYQFHNDRKSMSHIKSKGKTHGEIFAPHLEIASPWALDHKKRYFIEPFAAFDWVKSWQHSFTETGSSGFNLKMKSIHGSLLQSEIGLRFYERFSYCWGDFQLEEKVSYINQAPFFDKNVTTAFVGSPTTFPIAIGSTKTENLASVGLMANFVPVKNAYPFGGFAAQVTVNDSYQSYYVSVFGGWNF